MTNAILALIVLVVLGKLSYIFIIIFGGVKK